MPRCIDAEKLEALLQSFFDSKVGIASPDALAGIQRAQKIIAAMPAADVQEVKHGKWLTEEYMYGRDDMEDSWVERLAEDGDCAYCSECRKNAGLDGGEEYVLSNYCPNCGAKMDLGRSPGE